MWTSTKAAVSAAPLTSTVSCASRGPQPAMDRSAMARSVATHSRVPGTKTLPPLRRRSAGSSPRATASTRGLPRRGGTGASYGEDPPGGPATSASDTSASDRSEKEICRLVTARHSQYTWAPAAWWHWRILRRRSTRWSSYIGLGHLGLGHLDLG